MNKLGRKLAIAISVSILFLFTLSMLTNYFLLPRYYQYQIKKELQAVAHEIETTPTPNLEVFVRNLEEKYNVTIVYEKILDNEDDLNWQLREKLAKKKISLNRFWITKDTLQQVREGQNQYVLYDQGKLKSSFSTSLIEKDNLIMVVGVSIVHFREAAEVINTFMIYTFGFAMSILLFLVWIWSRKITNPLKVLTDISQDISQLDFKKVNIKTNDEIEELADSINKMSDELKIAHEGLKKKNQNLKRFMSDITHELKTPLALMKAYSVGIQDGLDDGTYLPTIIRQIDNVSSLIDELLEFSRVEREELKKTDFNLIPLVHSCLEKYQIEMNQKQIGLDIHTKIHPSIRIYADPSKIEKVLNNLISNAIKYTEGPTIHINMDEINDDVLFTVENQTSLPNSTDITRIWEPFYVGEFSRNKDKFGTGLGLAIVQSILQRHQIEYGVRLFDSTIQFYIYFPKTRDNITT
ncbi:HAMP domain-containing sensor histidine kinase [Thermoactinomyces sp. DSM 45892]|uniref:sensor histidine kinase n=1 Tax=Thermoactinomyces sp. DSM 45892 TaxID=1882753 RepID=UPI00089AFCAD|nr:HAMP domain-containing sensor histidine kinase [Thermoactinomyces sp. DSM 45892]SDZ35031.1 Signal transduction histidine kinase [Thermoactinomyces sp. DSM 45892]